MKKIVFILFAMCFGLIHLYGQDTTIHTTFNLNKINASDSNLKSLPSSTATNYNSELNLPSVYIQAFSQKKGKFLIKMIPLEKNLDIYYTTDYSIPNLRSKKYKNSFLVKAPLRILVQTFKDGKEYGKVVLCELVVSLNKPITFKDESIKEKNLRWSTVLTDGVYGSTNYIDRRWLGFEGKELVATIDLLSKTKIKSIDISYLVNENERIFKPSEFIVEVSKDSITYNTVKYDYDDNEKLNGKNNIREFKAFFNPIKGRYVRITIKNKRYHYGEYRDDNKKDMIYIDEISVNKPSYHLNIIFVD